VDPTARCLPWAHDVRGLLDLGGLPREALLFGPYLSPFYSPELFGHHPTSLFGPETRVGAGLAAVFTGAFDSCGAGFVSAHVLLLSWRLLTSLLGRPASLHGGRTAPAFISGASFPLIVQNVHRYSCIWPVASRVSVRTTSGRRCGFSTRPPEQNTSGWAWHVDPGGECSCCLSGYALACHSLRHLVVAFAMSFQKQACYSFLSCVSCLNRRHMLWA